MSELFDFYNNKKVFITGHTGFKGTWLCRILILAGAEVTGYALEPPTNPSLFEMTQTAEKITSIIGDVRDGEKLMNAVKAANPDVIFHMAAQPLVRLSYDEPVMTYETNVMGTVNILEAVRQLRADGESRCQSFVNVTTDKVYENKEWHWGYRENENLCGYDPYSNSKSCSELVTYSYRNSFFADVSATGEASANVASGNVPAISTARSGNVIGGGDYAKDRIIPDCIRAVSEGKEIVLRNPHSTRPYQHVLECLGGYLLLAKRQYENKSLAGSYNFGPDDESCVATGQLADMFCDAWNGAAGENGDVVGAKNKASWRVQGDGGPHEANFLKLDCSKSKAVLRWKPKWDIATAVRKIVEWQKRVNGGEDAGAVCDVQIEEYFGV